MAVSEGKPTTQITAFVEGFVFLGGGGAFVGVCHLCAGGWWRVGVVPLSLCVLGRQDWPVLQEVELRHCGCALRSFSGPAPEVVQN